jgi:hypothetical protein
LGVGSALHVVHVIDAGVESSSVINAKDRRPRVATVGKVRVDGSILGSSVGDELPHDIVTFVVEWEPGIVDGFFATDAARGTLPGCRSFGDQ